MVVYLALFFQLREVIVTHNERCPDRLFIPDDRFNHIATPNYPAQVTDKNQLFEHIKINAQGLREENDLKLPKPADTYRVLMVGDSFIFGGVDSLPSVIEDTLNRSFQGTHFELINCGTPSFSPLLHLARLKHQLLDFEADAIIYVPDLTDIYDDTHRYRWLARFNDAGALIHVKGSTRIRRAKRRHKRLFNHLLFRLGLKKHTMRDVRSPDPVRYPHLFDHAREDTKNPSKFTLEEISYSLSFISQYMEIARAKGIHVSIAMYPHEPQIIPERLVYGINSNRVFNRLFETAVRQFAERQGISFRSFYKEIRKPVLEGRTLYANNDMHFNDYGFKLLAELFADWIVEHPVAAMGFKPDPPPGETSS